MKKVIGIFSLSYLFAFCQAQSLKTNWLLVRTDDFHSGAIQMAQGKKITLQFVTDSTYTGKVCNGFRGNYKATKSEITLSKAASTKKYCPETSDLEKELLENLSNALSYHLNAKNLIILTSNHKKLSFVAGKSE